MERLEANIGWEEKRIFHGGYKGVVLSVKGVRELHAYLSDTTFTTHQGDIYPGRENREKLACMHTLCTPNPSPKKKKGKKTNRE